MPIIIQLHVTFKTIILTVLHEIKTVWFLRPFRHFLFEHSCTMCCWVQHLCLECRVGFKLSIASSEHKFLKSLQLCIIVFSLHRWMEVEDFDLTCTVCAFYSPVHHIYCRHFLVAAVPPTIQVPIYAVVQGLTDSSRPIAEQIFDTEFVSHTWYC